MRSVWALWCYSFLLTAANAGPAISPAFGPRAAATPTTRQDSFIQAIQTVNPSVVFVRAFAMYHNTQMLIPTSPELGIAGTAAGVIQSRDGHILTNLHVVSGATRIEVLIFNEKFIEAKIVGTDEEKDLALIKIDVPASWKPLQPVRWPKKPIRVGDWVMKAGFPGAVFTNNIPTFALGIVSNTRVFKSDYSTPFGVTDAQITLGDSGGPLFNIYGEVIGIDSFVSVRGVPTVIGHYIPSEVVLRTLPKLYRGLVRTGWLGFNPSNCENMRDIQRDGFLRDHVRNYLAGWKRSLPTEAEGILFLGFGDPDFGGDTALLQIGDIFAKLNNRKPQDKQELIQWIAEVEPGTEMQLRIIRDGKPLWLRLRAGEFNWEKYRRQTPAQRPGTHRQ